MPTHLGDERQVKESVDQRKQAAACMQRQTPMRKVQTPEPWSSELGDIRNESPDLDPGTSGEPCWTESRAWGDKTRPPASSSGWLPKHRQSRLLSPGRGFPLEKLKSSEQGSWRVWPLGGSPPKWSGLCLVTVQWSPSADKLCLGTKHLISLFVLHV